MASSTLRRSGQLFTSIARPLSWFEAPGWAAAVIPQRPAWYQRYSRYCCATVRYALLSWISPPSSAARSRSVRASRLMYGSTAEPVKTMPAPSSSGTSCPGSMQSTSSAICRDSSITTALEQPLGTWDSTVDARASPPPAQSATATAQPASPGRTRSFAMKPRTGRVATNSLLLLAA